MSVYLRGLGSKSDQPFRLINLCCTVHTDFYKLIMTMELRFNIGCFIRQHFSVFLGLLNESTCEAQETSTLLGQR